MGLSITIALATLASGVLDDATNAARFDSAYSQFKADLETEESTIADAVHAQFDTYPGASQNMPALVHGTLNRLNVDPSNYGSMEAKVLEYVRKNSDQPAKVDRKTKEVLVSAEPARTRLFGIKKGQGGGVCRWSDVPEKA
jgi:hypothetical protein